MNAVLKATLPQHYTREWRQFWQDNIHFAGPDVRLELGDDWATVRCSHSGRLLDQFNLATIRSEIIGRLAQLRLERAPR